MSKAKLERLFNLTALLLETPRPLTAEEVHARVSGYPEGDLAFRQAFERDKAELREMGIPLSIERPTTEDNRPGVTAYRIHKDDYYLRDPGLDATERAALHMAGQVVRLDGLSTEGGLAKLESAAGPGDAGGSSIDDATVLSSLVGPDLVTAAIPDPGGRRELFEAAISCRPVRFTYKGESRTVDPYRTAFQRGHWYLTGFDHLRQGQRFYRLDRVEGEIEVLDGPRFDRPGRDEIVTLPEPWLMGDGDPLTARLLVDWQQAPWAESYLGEAAVVERLDDGGVVVELEVTDRASFRSFVLVFLEHAEVLSPPELREEVVTWLTGLTGLTGLP